MKSSAKRTWNQLKAPAPRKRIYVMTERDTSTKYSIPVCYHEFDATDYRSGISMSAFTSYKHTRYEDPANNRSYYGIDRKEEFELGKTQGIFSSYNPSLPVVYHKTLWDLYKHIGYDYKTKKYIK